MCPDCYRYTEIYHLPMNDTQSIHVSQICSDVCFSLLRYAIEKTPRRVVLLYLVLPCRRLSSDCRHVRHKPTIKPRSGGVLILTIDYMIRSYQFNHLDMTGVRARHPCPPQLVLISIFRFNSNQRNASIYGLEQWLWTRSKILLSWIVGNWDACVEQSPTTGSATFKKA